MASPGSSQPKLFRHLPPAAPPSPPLTPPALCNPPASQARPQVWIEPSPERPITAIPLRLRPPSSKSPARLVGFNVFYFASVIFLHISQLLVLPFVFITPTFAKLPARFTALAKQTFAIILVISTQVNSLSATRPHLLHSILTTTNYRFDYRSFTHLGRVDEQFFGPTELVITSDEGLDLNRLVRRDRHGWIDLIDLPKRSVMMANHQIYADWLYIWCLAYLAELHGSIVIILKASLKWMPIVGPAMQLFSFIFLNRSWASDKASLSAQLARMADQVAREEPGRAQHLDRLALLIFPEGTLVSPLTRPVSKKFADTHGLTDLRHCLLPRSTGSLFCIRALSRRIPDLQLVDLTIGYPGIPPDGYGQDYYTLQSIFGHGHAPPQVHMHLRIIPMNAIPLGTSTGADASAAEAAAFDDWLRAQWTRKDAMLARFYSEGRMAEGTSGKGTRVVCKVGLRGSWDAIRTAVLAVPGGLVVAMAGKLVLKSLKVI